MHDNIITIAYADCFSGISGDMFLAALLDAGLAVDTLQEQLAGLDLPGWELECSRHTCQGIAAARVGISVRGAQHHRSWRTIRKILEQSHLADATRQRALKIFTTLAQAEARIHGCAPEDVHFHEVGGIDAIIDIVGAAIGLETLKIGRLICSPLPMPRGWVRCEHGLLPLPAPAVCEILQNAPVYGVDLETELVTPTGAAIAMAMNNGFGQFPSMTIRKVGHGAGSKMLANGQPNLLRLVIGEAHRPDESQVVEIIETNMDDWSPEGFPYLNEKLFALKALDVSLTPMQMKKGRPGFLLRVICDPAHALALKQCIFSETTSIGLRSRREQRWTLPRLAGTVNTCWGEIAVKKVETPTGPALYPEYEDCRRVAGERQIPLKKVYQEISRRTPDEFRPNSIKKE